MNKLEEMMLDRYGDVPESPTNMLDLLSRRDSYQTPVDTYRGLTPEQQRQSQLLQDIQGQHKLQLSEYENNKTDLRTLDGKYGSPVTVPGSKGSKGMFRYQTNPYTGTNVGKPGFDGPSEYQQARQKQIYDDDFYQKYGFHLYNPESFEKGQQEYAEKGEFDLDKMRSELKRGAGYPTVTKPSNPMHDVRNNPQGVNYAIPGYRYPAPTPYPYSPSISGSPAPSGVYDPVSRTWK